MGLTLFCIFISQCFSRCGHGLPGPVKPGKMIEPVKNSQNGTGRVLSPGARGVQLVKAEEKGSH